MRREFTTLSGVVGLVFDGELDSCCMQHKILLFGGNAAVLLTAEGDEDGCSLSIDYSSGHHNLVTSWGFDKGELISHDLLSDGDLEQMHKAEQKKDAQALEARREQFERLKKEFGDGREV